MKEEAVGQVLTVVARSAGLPLIKARFGLRRQRPHYQADRVDGPFAKLGNPLGAV